MGLASRQLQQLLLLSLLPLLFSSVLEKSTLYFSSLNEEEREYVSTTIEEQLQSLRPDPRSVALEANLSSGAFPPIDIGVDIHIYNFLRFPLLVGSAQAVEGSMMAPPARTVAAGGATVMVATGTGEKFGDSPAGGALQFMVGLKRWEGV